MNPFVTMTAEQIEAHVKSSRVDENEVGQALSRLAGIARSEGCGVLAVLLDTLADEPEDVAVMRLPALRDLMIQERFAIIPAAIAVLESVDADFSMPAVLFEGVAT